MISLFSGSDMQKHHYYYCHSITSRIISDVVLIPQLDTSPLLGLAQCIYGHAESTILQGLYPPLLCVYTCSFKLSPGVEVSCYAKLSPSQYSFQSLVMPGYLLC